MVRKVGEHLRGPSYTESLIAVGAGKLGLPIPDPLLSLLGLHKGQRLRARVAAGEVTFTVRRTANSPASGIARKRAGADRVRFEAKWCRLVRSLSRSRRWRRP